MAKTLEFLFDYVSPTSWLAWDLAARTAREAGAGIIYTPVFLGGIMQATDNRPPGAIPAKGAYLIRDVARCAAHLGIPCHFNPAFPFNTLAALRATAGLAGRPEAGAFRDACFHAAWGRKEPVDLGRPEGLAEIARSCGLDPDEVAALARAPENKEAVRENTEAAVARGVFGAPSFFVGDELFFGHDRLDYVGRALAA